MKQRQRINASKENSTSITTVIRPKSTPLNTESLDATTVKNLAITPRDAKGKRNAATVSVMITQQRTAQLANANA